MFRGRFEYTIDDKGRMSIPARYRDVMRARGGETLMVTSSAEPCLSAYAMDDWPRVEAAVSGLTDPRREVQAFKRRFLGDAVDLSLDKQGRILVPGALRDHAGLDHHIVLIGLVDKFEIWSRERWEEQMRLSQDNPEAIAQALAGAGLKI